MANKIFFPPIGTNTFADNLVGVQITDAGGLLSTSSVVQDDTIITGDGPSAAKKFAKTIHSYLKKNT